MQNRFIKLTFLLTLLFSVGITSVHAADKVNELPLYTDTTVQTIPTALPVDMVIFDTTAFYSIPGSIAATTAHFSQKNNAVYKYSIPQEAIEPKESLPLSVAGIPCNKKWQNRTNKIATLAQQSTQKQVVVINYSIPVLSGLSNSGNNNPLPSNPFNGSNKEAQILGSFGFTFVATKKFFTTGNLFTNSINSCIIPNPSMAATCQLYANIFSPLLNNTILPTLFSRPPPASV